MTTERQPAPSAKLKQRRCPDGLHVFDRTSGWNVLLNEVVFNETEWSTAPRHVSIALTNACELACSYCYAPKHPATLRAGRVTKWLTELDHAGCLGVGFGGGEPTLHRHLPELCEYASQRTGLAVTLTTHGHRLTPQLLNQIEGRVHFIRVSMDGVGDTYERLRGRSFASLLARLRDLHSVSRFGLNYVVNGDTIGDLDAAARVAEAVGASELLLLPEQPTKQSGGVDPDTALAFRSWVHSYAGTIRLTVSEAGSEGLPVVNALPGDSGLGAYAHIDASGIAKTSSFDSRGVPINDADGVMAALTSLRDRGVG